MESTQIVGTSSETGPELFVGLVGAVGTDLELVVRLLTDSLATVRYSTKRTKSGETSIRLARLLHKVTKYKGLKTEPVDVYTDEHMSAGDDFRKITERDDALALLAITEIMDERKDASERQLLVNNVIQRRAFILRSLKNPKELRTLREVYDAAFYLLARVFSSRGEARPSCEKNCRI